jgi:uncharacterized protein (TIGR00270 family)
MGSCEICGAEKVGTRKVVMGRADVSACTRCIDSMNLEPAATPITKLQSKPGLSSGYSKTGGSHRAIMGRGEKELAADFASQVTKAREKMGLDKRQLAKKLAEKVNVIQSVEAGKWPTDAVIRKLERFFDIELMIVIVPEETSMVGQAPGSGMTLGDYLNLQD